MPNSIERIIQWAQQTFEWIFFRCNVESLVWSYRFKFEWVYLFSIGTKVRIPFHVQKSYTNWYSLILDTATAAIQCGIPLVWTFNKNQSVDKKEYNKKMRQKWNLNKRWFLKLYIHEELLYCIRFSNQISICLPFFFFIIYWKKLFRKFF